MSDEVLLTVLGTADLHGHVLNWDYVAGRCYQAHEEQVGLAKICELVRRERDRRGSERTLLVDAGDTIAGTPLTYYYARMRPASETRPHPMATVMNAAGYDAAAVGNHEFDYGIDQLRAWQGELTFPLLAANALDIRTREPAFGPYALRELPGDASGPVRVGILGLTNPGTAVWDRLHVSGVLDFVGVVEQARLWVPRMRRAGADVVLVLAHTGTQGSSSYSDAVAYPEHAANELAAQVPGVDAILAGHAHAEVEELFVVNRETGEPVLVTEPSHSGRRLSVLELALRRNGFGWRVVDRHAQLWRANDAVQDPEVVQLMTEPHAAVLRAVRAWIADSTAATSMAAARYGRCAALDLVHRVQAETVRSALGGDSDSALPLLSITAAHGRGGIPAGEVTVRHLLGMYPFDNTLLAVRLTGRQLREYLEASARYFRRVTGPGPHRVADLINAPTDRHPDGQPDYNYDVLGGLDAPVTYDIDVAAEPGRRVAGLAHGGVPVADEAEFVVAVNSYRQAGGGAFPHVSEAPVVYDGRQEVRELITRWARVRGWIDPAQFSGTRAGADWRLVAGGEPVAVADPPSQRVRS